LKPILQAIAKHPKLTLSLLVAGMHLSDEFGHTMDEIENDGFLITATVSMNPSGDTGFSMAESIGIGVSRLAQKFNLIKPDILLVLGDRIEALAGGIAAAYMNLPVAHIHGGDSAKAGLDESARHALTKFSHIHFPATKKSADRIIKMGEDKWRVNVVGAPGLDTILNAEFIGSDKLSKKFNIDLEKPVILFVQHSVTTEVEDAIFQIGESLSAIVDLGIQTILVYPNSDAGGRRMINVIEEYADKYSFIKAYKSLVHQEYLSLMKIASLMVGNSSSGIIESPSFHLPVVNIGSRQQGRERSENVIDVGYDKVEIREAIKRVLSDKKFNEKVKRCRNPYGDGKAAERIVNVLSSILIDRRLIQKRLTY
jgi:UDP-N-acetylglucosamine 2-epimerase (non-hydrolysing)/GDP/UDP-N,N'-diacetylbacillosamine 2-epimerase (hydrolysing)